MREFPPVESLRLGDGPRLLEALLAARNGQWKAVRDLLGRAAQRGEHDGSSPAQMASIATRWILAEAYERSGILDSAATYLELAIAPTRVPFSHLALRGLVYPFAERRLAILYTRMGQPDKAQRHRAAFESAFLTPDPELKPLLAVGDAVGKGD